MKRLRGEHWLIGPLSEQEARLLQELRRYRYRPAVPNVGDVARAHDVVPRRAVNFASAALVILPPGSQPVALPVMLSLRLPPGMRIEDRARWVGKVFDGKCVLSGEDMRSSPW